MIKPLLALLVAALLNSSLRAKDSHEAWLRYARIQHPGQYSSLPLFAAL